MIQRRSFLGATLKISTLLAVFGSAIYSVGCSLWQDILNWVPVGEAALNSILALLSSNGVMLPPNVQAIVQLVEAGFTALTAAIKEYQSTTPPPVGALEKIRTAFKDIVDNFSTFLQALNVSGGLLSLIAGIAQIILSTIAAFVNQLPTNLPKTFAVASSVRVGVKDYPVVPKKRSNAQFKHDVDAVLKAGVAVGITVPEKAYL